MYPAELIQDVIEWSNLQPGDRILEIGCGTGQLTMDFLRRGYSVVAVEKGPALAQMTAEKMENFAGSRVDVGAFEAWRSNERFPLAISGQAFHWIDAEPGIRKVKTHLQRGGCIALAWHIDESQRTSFWAKTNEFYKVYLPEPPLHDRPAGKPQDYLEVLQRSKDLGPVMQRSYEWQQTYSKEEYLGLLSTFSGHMAMEEAKRRQFFGKLGGIVDDEGGEVVRFYRTLLLFVAVAT